MRPQVGNSKHGSPVRVARIVGRLNIGGPAVQAITLSRRLDDHGFRTDLIRGSEEPLEGSMDDLAEEMGVTPIRVRAMRREVGWRDVPALIALWHMLREIRPSIVHTEAAKAGTLGRAAALLLGRHRRPVIAHTFHGHSLEGYFSPRRAAVFLAIERFLARRTDLLIAVSDEVADDLARLGVASRSRIRVVPLGIDFAHFEMDCPERVRQRRQLHEKWAIPDGRTVVTLIARLVPIKRVDRFLRIARLLAARRADVHFVIVGDGELGDDLRSSQAAKELAGRLTWAGFVRDVPGVCSASDVIVLTSDNEGTPVSLIEAQAAALPVVGTAVGGMASVVLHGRTGYLVKADDDDAFADAIESALQDGSALGAAGREHAHANFSQEVLLQRMAALYDELLSRRSTDVALDRS